MNIDLLVNVSIKITDINGLPQSNCKIKLYDKDLLSDDFLGEGTTNSAGEVKITFDPNDAASWDSPDEEEPDLYFVVFRDGEKVYKSKTMQDVDLFKNRDNQSKYSHIDLGTHSI